MLTTNNILKHLPRFIAEDPYVQEVLSAKEGEFNNIQEVQADILAQFKVDTATWGLTWWERSLGLPTASNPTGIVDIEQDDPIIRYFGEWQTIDLRAEDNNFNRANDSDGFIKRAYAKDTNWFEFSFYGTGFKLFRSAANREESGFIITIDGEKIFSNNNKTEANPVYNWCFFERLNLSPGLHSVRVTTNPLSGFDSPNRYFVMDKMQIINSVDTNYDLRRKKIKAKLVPLTNVTNEAIKELAKSYGFEITIDESVPYVYGIDFEQNSNVDLGLRRQLLLDLEQIIPSHIQLDSKFFISTFYDIEQHQMTWDEANKLYVFFDFLTNSKPDLYERYTFLNKYKSLTKFNFEHFNSDSMQIDKYFTEYVTDREHDTSSTQIKNKSINYNFMTADAIHTKFSYVNRQLLSDSKRNMLTRMTTGLGYDGQILTDVVSDYKDKRLELATAIETNAFLSKREPVEINKNTFVSMLDKTKEFAATNITYAKTNVTPEQVIKGKVVYHQPNTTGGVTTLNKVVGVVETYNPENYFNNIRNYPNGIGLDNVVLEKDYKVPRQIDLTANNIKKDTVIFGIRGTMEVTPNDYNKDDILFDWQLESQGASFKILC